MLNSRIAIYFYILYYETRFLFDNNADTIQKAELLLCFHKISHVRVAF